MPLELARKLGAALEVRSETKIRQIDRAMQGYVRFTPQSPGTSVPGAIDASQVISGVLADARISESSVTQHEAALEIDWLQLTGVPSTFTPSAHNHNASDLNAGTLADARVAQSNVTQHQAALALAATQLTSGVLADARVQQSNVTQHQAALALAATQITSGVLANARVQQSNVTQHEAALDIDWLQLTGVPSTFTPSNHLTSGSWTPIDSSGAGLAFSGLTVGTYSKHENLVVARAFILFPPTADATQALIGGLPFSGLATLDSRQGSLSFSDVAAAKYVLPVTGSTTFRVLDASGNFLTNAQLSNGALFVNFIYPS